MSKRDDAYDGMGCLGIIVTILVFAALAVALGFWIVSYFLPK